jgi:hypothetical protein
MKQGDNPDAAYEALSSAEELMRSNLLSSDNEVGGSFFKLGHDPPSHPTRGDRSGFDDHGGIWCGR